MRILVSVSSRHGGTYELGQQITSGLQVRGIDVEQVMPDSVMDLDRYDAIVLGAAVYLGRVGLDLKDLIARQGAAVVARPVWVFWSGPLSSDLRTTPLPQDVQQLAQSTRARQIHTFGGRLNRNELTSTEKNLLATLPAQPGDHRDLAEAYSWGLLLGDELLSSGLSLSTR